MNLISNATEAASGENGRVEVETGIFTPDAACLAQAQLANDRVAGEYAFVEVRDNGPDMD